MKDSIYQRQLSNGKWRYEGHYQGIAFAIDSACERSKESVREFLLTRTITYLLNKEGYIIHLD